jgi:phosphopantetheine adenylyltransferase
MPKSIAFTFGRFNPPTIGHEKLIDKTRGANKNYRVYASQTQDAKRNPLNHRNKIAIMRDMFPAYARKISRIKKTTAIDVMVQLYKEKHTDVLMVVGSDRVAEFNTLLNKYNGKKATHGFYKFKSIRVVSAGERDPDAEGASGMSASKMRKAAQDNDYKTFQKGLPTKFRGGKKLFKILQKEMGVKSLKEWNEIKEVSPPGWEGSVKAMKKHKEIDNPWALAWHMKNKGDKAHYKDKDGKPEKKAQYKNEELKIKEATPIIIGTLKKKKDTGPKPSDQMLPKNKASRLEGFKKYISQTKLV